MSAAFSLEEPVGRAVATTTMLFRLVGFVCPQCGAERRGAHVDSDDGETYVECDVCTHQFDASLLRVPTQEGLEQWRTEALLHANTAVQCADGIHGCSYLALASCRRLAPEMTVVGKMRFLDAVIESVGAELSGAQRMVVAEIGVALGLHAAAINGVLAVC